MRQSNKLANKLWLASLFVRIRGSPAISPLRFEVDFERCTHGARSRSPAEIRASYARKVKQYNAPPGAPPRHYRRPPLSPAPDLSPFFRLSSFPLDTHLSSSPFLFRLLSFLPRSAVEREREGESRERVATMRNLLSWSRTMRATLPLSFSTAAVVTPFLVIVVVVVSLSSRAYLSSWRIRGILMVPRYYMPFVT